MSEFFITYKYLFPSWTLFNQTNQINIYLGVIMESTYFIAHRGTLDANK